MLLTRTPSDQVWSQVDAKAGSGASIIETAGPVSIKVSIELEQKYEKARFDCHEKCMLEVSDSFDCNTVIISQVLYELVDLVNGKRNIESCEGEVL